MDRVKKGAKTAFEDLFDGLSVRGEYVATFLAILELCKGNRVKISGDGSDAEITVIGDNFEVKEDAYVEYK